MSGEHWRVPRLGTGPPHDLPDGTIWTAPGQPICLYDVAAKIDALAAQVRSVVGGADQVDAWEEVCRLRLLLERAGVDPDTGVQLATPAEASQQ